MGDASEALRLDKWLWAARFFRTRRLATDAVKAGHVSCNSVRAKPGRGIAPGDRLRIRRGEEEFEIEVRALSARRLAAPLAAELYAESAESQARREETAARRRAERLSAPRPPPGRPDKHARRALRRLAGHRED